MAAAQSILFQINSTNYSGAIATIYKPQVECSGFITTLRLTINLNSIEEANFPYIPDDTPADVLQQILEDVAVNTEFKEVVLYLKKGNGVWIERAPIRIFNKDPYYDVNLMRFFSDANTVDVSEDLSLGIQIKVGNTLTVTDSILVWGTVVEEKKNNGNEELEARIEVLELALAGKLTELPANTLLGRDTSTGIVQQIPQNRFAKPTDIDTAIFNLIGGAPGALNTLDELAAALADDANFVTTMTNLLATKAPIASPAFTGFTTLGDNIAIKKKYITGTTGVGQGDIVTIPHGVTQSKVRSVNVFVEYSAGSPLMASMFVGQVGYCFGFYTQAGNIVVQNVNTYGFSSANILSKPVHCIIEYIA